MTIIAGAVMCPALGAVHLTAGLDEGRTPGPDQTNELIGHCQKDEG
jgi:hypothetical protein